MAVPESTIELPPSRESRRRRWGALLFVACGIVLVICLWPALARRTESNTLQAFIAGSIAAGATALGTLPILFSRTISARTRDVLLGFGAGIMLAASSFSLVLPAIESARQLGSNPWGAGCIVGVGIFLGALLLLLLDRYIPHEHFIKGPEGGGALHAQRLRRTWLFVFAITLHNLPEGLAIGVAYGGPDRVGAASLATGISIQDMPEGLVIALALLGAGYRRGFSTLLGAVSGLIEPLGAALGAAIMSISVFLLPWGLSIAAGAMLFVISHEIIPESHRQGHEQAATIGLMMGFVVMTVLDTVFK